MNELNAIAGFTIVIAGKTRSNLEKLLFFFEVVVTQLHNNNAKQVKKIILIVSVENAS